MYHATFVAILGLLWVWFARMFVRTASGLAVLAPVLELISSDYAVYLQRLDVFPVAFLHLESHRLEKGFQVTACSDFR